MLSPDYRIEELHRHTTSGSTGVSLETYRDDASQQWKRACTLRSDEWSGWRLGEKRAAVWGNPVVRKDWKGRLRRAFLQRDVGTLDTLDMTEEDMHLFADLLQKHRPTLLFGHAHSIYIFADFVHKFRPDFSPSFKGIISSSMMLYPWQRELIEKVFQCQVTNRYGCEEVSLIACECEKHEGLHVNLDGVFVELVDQEGTPVGPEVPGKILVTDLVNRAMPIFRYEVGDMASWAAQPCSCGRTLPLLRNIEGRVADYVLTPTGKYISGISLTENFALKIRGVGQCQIIQETIDHFHFNIVPEADFDEESRRQIQEKVHQLFGEGVTYDCEYVDRIPQESSGKYRFCISKVLGNVGRAGAKGEEE
jgi:phenylacetate-CoA ligase